MGSPYYPYGDESGASCRTGKPDIRGHTCGAKAISFGGDVFAREACGAPEPRELARWNGHHSQDHWQATTTVPHVAVDQTRAEALFRHRAAE
jgi:hypothetical protein